MYNHEDIEKRCGDVDYKTKGSGEKIYTLSMFPYPSGTGLHMGHARIYIGADIYARKKRMEGFDVLQPMGWDAFGLPAEEHAIKTKTNPKDSTEKNIKNFKETLKKLGLSYDWSREINTTDPKYYKWTQWMFLKMWEEGLVYEEEADISWCPSCKTGLANEDLEDDKCERCGTKVEKKPMRQWFIKITEYADRLLDDLDMLDGWDENVKNIQREWIGKSYGHRFSFETSFGEDIEVYSTRIETLHGGTFLAISHKKYLEIKDKAENEIKEGENKEVKGVHAINPLTKEEIPIFVADYVISTHGTGAVFACPSCDERDYQFAKENNIKIIPVIEGDMPVVDVKDTYTLINSGKFDGLKLEDAREKIAKKIGAKETVQYRLEDWVFSRQRYWGEPIPLIHCDKCGVCSRL